MNIGTLYDPTCALHEARGFPRDASSPFHLPGRNSNAVEFPIVFAICHEMCSEMGFEAREEEDASLAG